MGLTSISQVRNHLNRINLGEGDIRNRAVRLTSESYVNLPHGHIVTGSETVKAVENDIPYSEIIALDSSPVSLTYSRLVSGTVICAGDSSLSKIYQENIDFSVDYGEGTVARIDGGGIEAGSDVSIWYLYYRVYQRGVDYLFDYDRGRIRRIATGAIEEGQEIAVDYQLGDSEFSDAEIEQGITEAEAEIARLIHPDYRESTDPALQTAATCLTLSVLCRNAAGMAASSGSPGDRSLSGWMDLSDSYRQTAVRLLSWFRREMSGLRTPRLS